MSEELKKSILSKSIDPEQLDQAAGGRAEPVRPYQPEPGCANVSRRDDCQATVELGSYCWSDDACMIWDCTYDGCIADDVDMNL